jgi:hypothetical protein
MKAFNKKAFTGISKNFKILTALTNKSEEEVTIEKDSNYLFNITFPDDDRRHKIKK